MGEIPAMRYSGITCKPTGDTQWCPHCQAKQPIWKSGPIRLMDTDYIDYFCEQGHRLGGYAIVRPPKVKNRTPENNLK